MNAVGDRARRFDVLINGGGLAGLTLALLLRQPSNCANRIGVVEPRPPGGEHGLRVVALSPASRSILDALGAWRRMPAQQRGAFERMVVWHGDRRPGPANSIRFDAAEFGRAELGFIVGNDVLRGVLWQLAAADPGITLIDAAKPAQLANEPACITVTLENGTRLAARLLVGADGANSWVREQLGIAAPVRTYGQHGLVAYVRSERPHRHTAWQRFLPGGPVALLPLGDGRLSIVWSCRDEEAARLLEFDDAGFGGALTEATGAILGNLAPDSPRAKFPLATRHARRYTGQRFALIGDAAHQVHPLAGQGVNLGLMDAAALAETLAAARPRQAADPGDAVLLRRYERWRKGDNLLTLGMMEMLHRLFTHPLAPVPVTAAAGMALVGRLPPVKRRLAEQALGHGRNPPRVVLDHEI